MKSAFALQVYIVSIAVLVECFILTLFYARERRKHFCSPLFFYKSQQKKIFISNQLDFESEFKTNNSRKFEIAKVIKSYSILKVLRSHFPKSEQFQANTVVSMTS